MPFKAKIKLWAVNQLCRLSHRIDPDGFMLICKGKVLADQMWQQNPAAPVAIFYSVIESIDDPDTLH